MQREYRFYVYMLQSSSRRALYIGMTNNLRRRVFEHKTHFNGGFTINTMPSALCTGKVMTKSTRRLRVKSN